jgi:hypothetical protein
VRRRGPRSTLCALALVALAACGGGSGSARPSSEKALLACVKVAITTPKDCWRGDATKAQVSKCFKAIQAAERSGTVGDVDTTVGTCPSEAVWTYLAESTGGFLGYDSDQELMLAFHAICHDNKHSPACSHLT